MGVKRNRIRKAIPVISALVVLMMVLGLCGCGGGVDDKSLHISYSADEIYGSDDYLNSTVTFAGTEFSDEPVEYTVKKLEELIKDDGDVAYEGDYSMLSRRGGFKVHTYTGVRVYEMLLKLGMDEGLDDSTDVKFISKDGYTKVMKLSEVKQSGDNVYSSQTATKPSEENVPVILAVGSDGYPLAGPVGDTPVGEKITEKDGYNEDADNVGGPVRLVSGQKSPGEFNATDNAKWVTAVIVGDDNRPEDDEKTENPYADMEIPKDGQWTHDKAPYDKFLDSTLTISGSEAKAKKVYTLKELESDDFADSTERNIFGASSGVKVYQGVKLKDIVKANLRDGLDKPSKVTVVGADGYEKEIDVDDIMNGIDSKYQGGEHRDVLLAYSMNKLPLVDDKDAEGFDEEVGNGYGPIRLIVENQISGWIKRVTEIRLGD